MSDTSGLSPVKHPRRIAFVIRGLSYYPYIQSIVTALAARGHFVVIATLHGGKESLDKFSTPLPERVVLVKSSKRQNIVTPEYPGNLIYYLYLLVRGCANYARIKPRRNFYSQRWLSNLPRFWRRIFNNPVGWALLGREGATDFLRRREMSLAPDPGAITWLSHLHIDAVIVSPGNSRRPTEATVIKAARALGIPALMHVLSWDNLSTKGAVPGEIDVLTVWHDAHAEEARHIHKLADDKVVVCGAPFFDKWFDARLIPSPRDEYCRSVGLDPARPYICYLGSSKNIAQDEGWLVRQLLDALAANPTLSDMQVLVRPHPANDSLSTLKEKGNVVVLECEAPSDESAQSLLNAIHHARLSIGINTSAMVDSLILDSPTFSLSTGLYKDTHLDAAHFQLMQQSGALTVVQSVDELLDRVQRLEEDDIAVRPLRHEFVRHFIRPRGENAGEMCALVLERLMEKDSPASIGKWMRDHYKPSVEETDAQSDRGGV